MKKLFLFSIVVLYCCVGDSIAQGRHISVVPEPVQLTAGKGEFVLDKQTVIVVPAGNAELNRLARTLVTWLAPATGYELRISNQTKQSGKHIRLSLSNSLQDLKGDEGYRLKVAPNSVTITALNATGIFYGLQTLRQLLPAAIENSTVQTGPWTIPAVSITDYPRFKWRGLLLDVSRHFFSKEFVKKYIDQMARYKYNTLHWHLTDDQGWRIEIKAFPKLTEVGAWRVPRTGRWWTYEQPRADEKADYGGFYTQEEIKEIVAYARERHVSILPEIDVPGHSLAAIAAYPYLSATGYLYPVNPGSKFYNMLDNTLNPADERVYAFLDKVFEEVAAIFPHEYIHIGGDECTKYFWRKSAEVQAFMQQKNIKTEEELQSYFIRRMETMLKTKGKKLIGWDEILEGGLAPEATVMSWRGMQGGIEAAKQGHKVVMTPANNVYLDLYQGDPALEPDTYSMLRLKSSYQWSPLPEGIDPSLVLGGQGNLWTESVPTDRHAEYMTWPRGLALAEVFWSPENKQNWQDFQQKLEPQFARFDNAGVNYSRAAFDVLVTTRYDDNKSLLADLSTDIDDLEIYYTVDNTNPDIYSNKYPGKPVEIPKGIYQLRAQTYKNGQPVGKILILGMEELEKRVKK